MKSLMFTKAALNIAMDNGGPWGLKISLANFCRRNLVISIGIYAIANFAREQKIYIQWRCIYATSHKSNMTDILCNIKNHHCQAVLVLVCFCIEMCCFTQLEESWCSPAFPCQLCERCCPRICILSNMVKSHLHSHICRSWCMLFDTSWESSAVSLGRASIWAASAGSGCDWPLV